MASNSRSKGHGGGEICRHVFSRARGIVVMSICRIDGSFHYSDFNDWEGSGCES